MDPVCEEDFESSIDIKKKAAEAYEKVIYSLGNDKPDEHEILMCFLDKAGFPSSCIIRENGGYIINNQEAVRMLVEKDGSSIKGNGEAVHLKTNIGGIEYLLQIEGESAGQFLKTHGKEYGLMQ